MPSLEIEDLDRANLDQIIAQAADEQWTDLVLARVHTLLLYFQKPQRVQRIYQFEEHIEDLAAKLAPLTHLTSLYLTGNAIGDEGAKTIAATLTNLTSLYLGHNAISDEGVKAIAAKLTKLRSLGLDNNAVGTEGARSIAKSLANLKELDLGWNSYGEGWNKIGDEGAKAIAGLTSLTSLDVSKNEIGADGAKAIANLTNLTSLNLSRNSIGQIPKGLIDLPSLQSLNLRENPIQDIDAELYSGDDDAQTLRSLRDYFRGLGRGVVKQDQVKLLLVGNGRVGKTSILNRLLGHSFNEKEESTHGIQLRTWKLEGVAPERLGGNPAKVSLWDFAGQDIYHATHRLFMRTRALFLLVWDSETESTPCFTDEKTGAVYENFPLPYWIGYIKILSGSPVIITQNKVDRPEGKQLNYGVELQQTYPPPSGIADFAHVSAKKATQNGMADLTEKIQQALSHLGTVGYELPAQWVEVRDQIKELKDRYISYERFEAICPDDMEGTEPQSLASFLHQAGEIFYQPESFGDRLILDQQWAINGVYAVLDRSKDYYQLLRSEAKDGLILDLLINKAWQEFSAEERGLLLEFMKSCELGFEYREGVYYVPQLLPDEKPARVADRWQGSTEHVLQISYDFLHRAIIERFIVRVGRHVEEDYPEIWRNGIVVLHQPSNTRAMVEATPEDRRILVQAKGDAPVQLLQMVQNELAELHEDFEPTISFSADSGEHFVEEKTLKQFAEAGSPKVPATDGHLIDLSPLRAFLRSGDVKMPEAPVKPPLVTNEPIFLSYAWGDPSEVGESREAIVDRLYETLMTKGLDVVRDKKDNGYKKKISTFMQRIGQGCLVVVVISNKYLRSPYCMYELLEIHKNGAFDKRVFPIVLRDAKLYKLSDRLEYVEYWKEETDVVEQRIEKIGLSNLSREGTINDYYDYYDAIAKNIDLLTSLLDDWNALTPKLLEENNFEILLSEIETRLTELSNT